jgi:hypothetical protein
VLLKEGGDPRFKKPLVRPGADIVVVDEAHTIKEKSAQITQSLNEVRTKMRIGLTVYSYDIIDFIWYSFQLFTRDHRFKIIWRNTIR